ncbi:MAG: DHA2 family efflux MFS transporter permease subunit [Steroidobacteraceae bacterium]|nr:DHA2 family efflux MFS transporter permease subunit [Steroidobacteraceae bacterium]
MSEPTVSMTPAARRLLIASLMLATVIYTLDTTIANVALPHMQGSMQASHEQIAWVLTSYIVVSAIVTPLTGFLSQRFGQRRLLLLCVGGFTVASMLCGLATTLPQIVVCRMLQGAFGAGLVPISQTVLLSVYPREHYGSATAIWGMGIMVGPILGPTLGGWLTEMYGWRWVFFINLPVGVLALVGIAASIPRDRPDRVKVFDGLGYGLLALAIGAFQLCIDRGNREDWFDSTEIRLTAFASVLFLYMFVVHSLSSPNPFLDRALFRDRNFVVGATLIFALGLMMLSTMVLMPGFLETLQGYPVSTVGWLLAPRGVGTMLTMFLVARLTHRIDARLLAGAGLGFIAISMLQMASFNAEVGWKAVAWSGFVQGLGMGLTFVPVTTAAFMTLEPRLRAEASALFSLLRNLGAGIGISVVVTLLARDLQANQARLVEHLGVFDGGKWLGAEDVVGTTLAPHLLAAEVQRQAASIAYANEFVVMIVVTAVALPLLLLMRIPRREESATNGGGSLPAAAD